MQKSSGKRWEWDQSPEYWCAISEDFIKDFCEYCNEREYEEDQMHDIETIWIYDEKKAEKRVKDLEKITYIYVPM